MIIRALILAAALVGSLPAHADSVAAMATAAGPQCAKQVPFYWEIGDATNMLASGSIGAGAPTRTTSMSIASASKWLYSSYVAEIRKGAFTPADVKSMNFQSGWTTFSRCGRFDSVATCAARAGYVAANDGFFAYGGGHMQKHAASTPLAPMRAAQLATTINGTLGTAGFSYTSPQLAGGGSGSAAAYAVLLQRIMSGKLAMGAHLADNAVATRGPTAKNSPVPEAWHYGIGHWIEDAPGNDGAFSSPGAFGFYPWISADKKLYGIVARKALGGAWSSVTCGRAIRKAFVL